MKLTLQQLEAHLWGAANILRGKTAGQDYKNYILPLMFYKRLCDQWECEADDGIAEQERQQGRAFGEQEKAVFRKRGEHRFQIPDGSRWGDVKTASTNLGEVLAKAMRAVANANEEGPSDTGGENGRLPVLIGRGEGGDERTEARCDLRRGNHGVFRPPGHAVAGPGPLEWRTAVSCPRYVHSGPASGSSRRGAATSDPPDFCAAGDSQGAEAV